MLHYRILLNMINDFCFFFVFLTEMLPEIALIACCEVQDDKIALSAGQSGEGKSLGFPLGSVLQHLLQLLPFHISKSHFTSLHSLRIMSHTSSQHQTINTKHTCTQAESFETKKRQPGPVKLEQIYHYTFIRLLIHVAFATSYRHLKIEKIKSRNTVLVHASSSDLV